MRYNTLIEKNYLLFIASIKILFNDLPAISQLSSCLYLFKVDSQSFLYFLEFLISEVIDSA